MNYNNRRVNVRIPVFSRPATENVDCAKESDISLAEVSIASRVDQKINAILYPVDHIDYDPNGDISRWRDDTVDVVCSLRNHAYEEQSQKSQNEKSGSPCITTSPCQYILRPGETYNSSVFIYIYPQLIKNASSTLRKQKRIIASYISSEMSLRLFLQT